MNFQTNPNLNRTFRKTLVCLIAMSASMTAAIAGNHTSGKATIYADSFNGKKTANGEKFKTQEVSAASNKLPLGSKVLVKNKATGKKAVVKINDRMSKHSTAAVDLSKGAAKKLGVKGTGQVDAKVLSK